MNLKKSHYILVIEIILISILHAVKIGGKGEFLKTNDVTNAAGKKVEPALTNARVYSSSAKDVLIRTARL